MDKSTARKLIEINKSFYSAVSISFDQTRQSPWLGWYELLPFLDKFQPLDTVDYGCGNGRFFQFLSDSNLKIKQAVGLDSDPALLKRASGRNLTNTSYLLTDLFTTMPDLPNTGFVPQVSTAFGILHHLPGRKYRLDWVRSLLKNTREQGLVVVSLWRNPKHTGVMNIYPELTVNFEPGDVWLGWQGQTEAVRYCHAFGEEEIEELMDLPARTIGRFEADGKDGQSNTYLYYLL